MREADGQRKPSWSSASRIDVPDATLFFNRRFVRMTAHDDIKPSAGRTELDLVTLCSM